MATSFEITGNIRDRFIQAAALLRLIDPVRGEPTAYGLDQESSGLYERLLRRKFLDAFALICATRKDADSVSAACLEESDPDGTIVRIASNAGVSAKTVRAICVGFQKAAQAKITNLLVELQLSEGELRVLLKIVELDIGKIRYYIKDLQKSNYLFEETIPAIKSRLIEASPHSKLEHIQTFLNWFEQVFPIKALTREPDLEIMLGLIRWAQKAKKTYPSFLRAAFAKKAHSLPRWVSIICKIGRYGVAATAMVQIASDLPTMFNPIFVESIPAPLKTKFSTRDEMPLTSVLHQVPEVQAEKAIPILAHVWDTTDPEAFFRSSCSVDLVAHAELQLVSFYDHNPHLKPTLGFIGVSKKSRYLCSIFLAAHPGGFNVSSCHQKLYLSWIPPPAVNVKVYKQYKNITRELSKKMEAIAKLELLGRLGLKRLPVPADSTAGVSLSGLTDWKNLDITEFEEHDEIKASKAAIAGGMYAFSHPSSYTSGKINKVHWNKRDSRLDGLDPEGVVSMDANSTRKATDEELKERFGFQKCADDDYSIEKQPLGIKSASVWGMARTIPTTTTVDTTTHLPTPSLTSNPNSRATGSEVPVITSMAKRIPTKTKDQMQKELRELLDGVAR